MILRKAIEYWSTIFSGILSRDLFQQWSHELNRFGLLELSPHFDWMENLPTFFSLASAGPASAVFFLPPSVPFLQRAQPPGYLTFL